MPKRLTGMEGIKSNGVTEWWMEGVNFGLLQQLRDIFQPFSELKRGYMEDHPKKLKDNFGHCKRLLIVRNFLLH